MHSLSLEKQLVYSGWLSVMPFKHDLNFVSFYFFKFKPLQNADPPLTGDDRSLAFLPWAHSYGQLCELHCGVALGASAGIAAGAPGDSVELLANIQEVCIMFLLLGVRTDVCFII